ncbi:DNA internalization-related competence protein ComEC/Rec2 [Bordetella genomosp. 1]|uniref:DNA internalization-related competence protein ComEC/Rec2 n=1 Tax=Bordetella genomosp. 1 TaxID=1395607 RepID=A0A261SID5_9BORD|nr:DNA internalization-related competence protein ComEC/Rec2 [Bordetella genomosp. 1]OZI36103.1 DNA internalization-related competence protein ComEC/Rec2 [Bordetella genomosp. 1]
MRGRGLMCGVVAGAGWVQFQPSLTHAAVGAAIVAALSGLASVARWSGWRGARGEAFALALACAWGMVAGASNAVVQAAPRLALRVPAAMEQQIVVASVRVLTLAQGDARTWRFMGEVEPARPLGLPPRALITWRALPGDPRELPVPAPGERWRMTLVVRRPRATLNPWTADQEGRWFAAGVRMLASVRGHPQRVDDAPYASAGVAVERLRHLARTRMQEALAGMRQGPLLIALALGDGAGIGRPDWDLFNRTGITHLVSISGLHVGLVAGLFGWAVSQAWRRVRWRGRALCVRIPASVAGMVAAVLAAGAYALLAGWSVPTRRTFFTLAALGVAVCLRLPLSRGRALALAAGVVVLLDPWAPLAPGFWLSFGAIAILMGVIAGGPAAEGRWGRLWRALRGFAVAQGLITLGMVPLLAWWTQQLSLVSPFANAVAIPLVSLFVTPLALLVAMLAALSAALPSLMAPARWVGLAADGLARAVMAVMQWLSALPHASVHIAAAPWPLVLAALAGVVWALQRPGWPGRHWGWAALAPLVLWRAPAPADGDWSMWAVDVGQGTSVILRTARHVLLYDTGPMSFDGWDAGERMVVPALRALGVRSVDTLVLSHADLDHVGGAIAVLRAQPVAQAYASFDLRRWVDHQQHLRGERLGTVETPMPAEIAPCVAGQAWTTDGVRFTFLHPPAGLGPTSTNARSCVLRVDGRHHSVLLLGDVPRVHEARFAQALAPLDVVVAAHHGSSTSSGPELVAAAHAAHVIFQAGYRNRYRHPTAPVLARWREAGAQLWRSDLDGAIRVESNAQGLSVRAQRETGRRYWHDVAPDWQH